MHTLTRLLRLVGTLFARVDEPSPRAATDQLHPLHHLQIR